MNAYEIEQKGQQMRPTMRLPLSCTGWADIERKARQERARVVGNVIAKFLSALAAMASGLGRQVRSTAADCTDARLRHH